MIKQIKIAAAEFDIRHGYKVKQATEFAKDLATDYAIWFLLVGGILAMIH